MLKDGVADSIISYKTNRLARNPIDQSYIEWYLQEGTIKEIVTCDGTFRHGDNVLMIRMYFGMSTQFVIDLKKDVARGMRSKLEKGWLVSKPPKWYSILDGEAVPNEDAQMIRDVFTLRTQWWGMTDIGNEMLKRYGLQTKHGKTVMHTYIEKVIKNPFYYWAMRWAGEVFNGRHDPIVSKEVWDRANKISKGVSYDRESSNPVFKLRGMVLDAETGAILTASLIKWRYTYFHTASRNRKKIYINQQAIVDWFDANIQLFVIPRPFIEPIKEVFRDMLKGKQEDTTEMRKKLHRKESILTTKKQGLFDMRMSGEITQEEFIEQKNRVTEDLQEVKVSLFWLDQIDDDILNTVDTLMVFCTNLVQSWRTGDLDTKIDIVKLLCTNLFVDEEKILTFKFYPLWEATYEVNKNPQTYGDFAWKTKWWTDRGSNPGPKD